MRLAVIDLGTNSVRFDVYDLTSLSEIERIHREKQMVRLGDDVFSKGVLNADACQRTLAAFTRFKDQIEKLEVDKVLAYATSALRDSPSRRSFIRTLKEKTGIRVAVITGKQEAQFIAKGILNNAPIPPGFFALVDIGGGSTEISVCHKRTVLYSESFNLGANRLQQTFLKSTPPKKDSIERLRRHIRREIRSLAKEKKWSEINSIVGSSGTIRAIRKILKKAEDQVEPFKVSSLTGLTSQMESFSREQLMGIPGMEPKRVDLILSGSILLEEIAKTLDARNVFTTHYSLRDGILEAELERYFLSQKLPN